VLVQGIEGETNSWGFFGLAYFTENSDQLTDIAVSEETGGECVEPTDETVLSGDYPLSRPLYIYVTKTALERPEVKAFVTSYLELTPDLISEVGYVAAPEGDYADGLARLG
jgi:phosphate transport system substrate-binding protein